MTSFHLIIAVAALLTTLGLIMVLSASGVRSYDDDGSAWVDLRPQVLWTIVGLVRVLPGVADAGAVHAAHGVLRVRVTIVMLVLVLVPGIGKRPTAPAGGS